MLSKHIFYFKKFIYNTNYREKQNELLSNHFLYLMFRGQQTNHFITNDFKRYVCPCELELELAVFYQHKICRQISTEVLWIFDLI